MQGIWDGVTLSNVSSAIINISTTQFKLTGTSGANVEKHKTLFHH